MKRYFILIAFAAFLVCPKNSFSVPIGPSSAIIGRSPENREVSAFNGIASSGDFNVMITMGSRETLRLEGDPEDLKEVETRVENGILKIRDKERSKPWRSVSGKNRVTVYVTAKNINSLSMSGSGTMKVEGAVKTDKLSNNVSGSGVISLTADANSYTASISGSGDIKINGSARSARIGMSGSGNFQGRDFKTDDTDIKVSGSGNASVYAEKRLDAIVSGSGDVRYGGNAQVSRVSHGSGRVAKY